MFAYSIRTAIDIIFYLSYAMPLIWNSISKIFPFIEP
jgi:hypothetical protein